MLCQLLVRGWTIKPRGHKILSQKLTSSNSVVLECDVDSDGDPYTVSISNNTTYVSKTGKTTVTAQFACLPDQYTDKYSKLSNSTIMVQRPSGGGGGGPSR